MVISVENLNEKMFETSTETYVEKLVDELIRNPKKNLFSVMLDSLVLGEKGENKLCHKNDDTIKLDISINSISNTNSNIENPNLVEFDNPIDFNNLIDLDGLAISYLLDMEYKETINFLTNSSFVCLLDDEEFWSRKAEIFCPKETFKSLSNEINLNCADRYKFLEIAQKIPFTVMLFALRNYYYKLAKYLLSQTDTDPAMIADHLILIDDADSLFNLLLILDYETTKNLTLIAKPKTENVRKILDGFLLL
jgi:hypothetical protein